MIPVWVILVLAAVLVVAVLVLITAIHLLDIHSERQCAHLHDLTSRSLQLQCKNQYRFRCGESQLCCVCGSFGNRRLQGVHRNSSLDSQGNDKPRVSSTAGLLQPLLGAGQLSSGSLECFPRLANRQKGTGWQQGGWFHGWGLSRRLRKPLESQVQANVESAHVASRASTYVSHRSASSGAPFTVTSHGGSNSKSLTTITATITTSTSAASSSTSSAGCSCLQTCSGNSGLEDGGCKPASQRRLVLEILMSPSGSRDGQGGTLPVAAGVRLKLETSGTLESLASLAAAAAAASAGAEASAQLKEAELEALSAGVTSGLTATSGGSVPVAEVNAITVNVPDSTRNSRGPVQGSRLGIDHPSISPSFIKENNSGDQLPQANITMTIPVLSSKRTISMADTDLDALHFGSLEGPSICLNSSERKGVNSGSSILPCSNISSSTGGKSRQNGHTTASTPSSKGKGKGGVHNSHLNLSAFLPGHVNQVGPPTAVKGTNNQSSFNQSLDGLGSLRIGILDACAKGKSVKDCTKGVTAEIASALAALNVDSIGGKGVGMVSTLVSGGVLAGSSAKVALAEPVASKQALDSIQEEEIHWEGSGSEQGVEEGDEQLPLAASSKAEGLEEEDVDGKKKEKRRKKNRGRRHKAKAVAAAGGEVHDRTESDRSSTERADNFSLAADIEIGCICGTPKGGCHANTCPYPFSNSGSMIQRKIREQYDELVRSNLAKTLTLAQVGRFTTCLVEAKSQLQQKSDTIQRRFTIAKSLLSKADKSSFDRLCGQIYGLEIEQKKLEEDTVVYNRLQEQLKLSPAYQKMLEYGRAHFELQPNTGQLIEKLDSEDVEISFEELLAREKKDSFWQKHGPSRSYVQVS